STRRWRWRCSGSLGRRFRKGAPPWSRSGRRASTRRRLRERGFMPDFFCVDSPFAAHCALEAIERLPDGVRSRVVLRPQLSNSWGGAHGGLIATLLDASMTVAARFAVHPEGTVPTSTTDLSVS